MSTPLLELEGTTESILERLTSFHGQRLHVSVQLLSPNEENNVGINGDNNLRPIGLCKGQFVVTDAFLEPLPVEIMCAFEETICIMVATQMSRKVPLFGEKKHRF